MSQPGVTAHHLSPLDLLEMRGLPRDISLITSNMAALNSCKTAPTITDIDEDIECDEAFDFEDDVFSTGVSRNASRSLRDISSLRLQRQLSNRSDPTQHSQSFTNRPHRRSSWRGSSTGRNVASWPGALFRRLHTCALVA
jgi:hypothetical protein